jgi:hypothetical protein
MAHCPCYHPQPHVRTAYLLWLLGGPAVETRPSFIALMH